MRKRFLAVLMAAVCALCVPMMAMAAAPDDGEKEMAVLPLTLDAGYDYNVYGHDIQLSFPDKAIGIICVIKLNTTSKNGTVTAGTIALGSAASQTVIINSKSYFTLKDAETGKTNGRTDNGGLNTVSGTYTATSYPNYVFNKHTNPNRGTIVYGFITYDPFV